jgi:GAF domain-containing protein
MTDSKEVKIIEALLRNATQVVEADLAYVALLDKVTAKLDFPLIGCKGATRALELQAGGQGRWASRDYQPDKLLPDRVIAGRKTVSAAADSASRAFQNNPTYPETDPETKQPLSWLGIPLVARGSAFGVVVVESHARERAFDERTQALLATMADRVASSLATARLLESLRAVNRVGQELTSGIRLRENAVLELIYQQIGPLMNTDNMYIALYDARRRMLSFPLARENGAAEQLPDREIGPADEAKGGLTEIVIRTREPLCLPNVQAWCEETGRQLPIPPIPKSWLGVPMILEDKVLGIISLRSVEYENLYGPDDQEVLQAMAGQAAVAIDNARLYYDTNQRLEALIEVGQALSSSILLQQAEILAQVHEQAGRLMDTRNMYVALYDQEKRELSFPLAFYQGAQQQWDSRPVDIADETKGGLTEVVIRTGRPLCPPDVEAEYEKRGLTPPVPPIPRSWLGVPMMSRGEAIGVIALQNDDLVNLYGPEDQEVLRSMAAQAAVAIENARLLQGAEWVGQLTALHEIGIKITSQLELDEVLGAVVDNANRILSADFSTLFPYDSARGEFGRGIRKGRLNVEPSIPSNTGLAARILEKQQPQWIKDAKSEPGVKPSFVEENQVSSFAAIPLISKGKGVGVLFVNYSETHTFSSQEQEVVRLLAAQAAAAIENARLFEDLRKAQERIVAAERRAFTNRFAGEFIHKLTGVAGTIPIRI